MIHYKSLVDNDISRRMEGSPENWGITVAREWVMRFKPIYDRMPENDYNNNIYYKNEKTISLYIKHLP